MGERPPSTLAGPRCDASNGRVRFGTFEVDLRAGELRKSGLKIKLHHQPFQVLALLLEKPGEVIRREEIQEKLWGSETVVDFEQGLNKAMNRLRDALGDSAENPRFIETFPRLRLSFHRRNGAGGQSRRKTPVVPKTIGIRPCRRGNLVDCSCSSRRGCRGCTPQTIFSPICIIADPFPRCPPSHQYVR